MTLTRFSPAGSDEVVVATSAGVVDSVSGSVTYETAANAGRGGVGVECLTDTAAATLAYFGVPAAAATDAAARLQAWISFPGTAFPSTPFGTGAALIEFCRLRSGTVSAGTNLDRLLIASSDHASLTPGTVVFQNSAGGGQITLGVLQPATTYRIELGAKPGTATATPFNGAADAQIYDNSDALLYQLNHPAADLNVGTAAPSRALFGKVAGTGASFQMYATQAGIDTGSSIPTIPTVAKASLISAAIAPNPADAGVSRTITVTVTGVGSGATINLSVDWGDGLAASTSTVAATVGATRTFTRTPTVSGSKVAVVTYNQA